MATAPPDDTPTPSTPLGHARPRGVERREARGLIWFAAAAAVLCLLIAISFNLVVSKTLRSPYTSPHTQPVTQAAPAATATAPTAAAATGSAPAVPAPQAASTDASGSAAASQPETPGTAPPAAAPPVERTAPDGPGS